MPWPFSFPLHRAELATCYQEVEKNVGKGWCNCRLAICLTSVNKQLGHMLPCTEEEGDFQAESAENQDYHWSWWNSDDWYWCWTSSSWVRGNSDENWQNWEVDSVTEGQGDWRLQPKYSWWWTA